MRLPLIAVCTAVLALAFAGTASADQPPVDPADFSFLATIDCGSGPVEVGSTDDIYAPLVELETGRKFEPVAWDVSFGDFHFVDVKEGFTVTRRNSMECSYLDEWVSGTVTLKRTRRYCDDDDRGDHRGRHHDRWDRDRHGRHSHRG
ncbi:MAG: hypothetical protein ABI611_12765 [Solirubrobacteraceae bacterium]